MRMEFVEVSAIDGQVCITNGEGFSILVNPEQCELLCKWILECAEMFHLVDELKL